MVKLLSFRFQQCFGPFTMSLVRGSSELGLFRHLSNHIFWSRKFENKSALRVISFLKNFKIESKFKKIQIKIQKISFVSKIIASKNKLPLLRRKYLSSAVNGITNSPQILHITQRGFLNLYWLHSNQ